MIPDFSSRLTRTRQALGERATCSARAWLVRRPSACSAARMRRSIRSSVGNAAMGASCRTNCGFVGVFPTHPRWLRTYLEVNAADGAAALMERFDDDEGKAGSLDVRRGSVRRPAAEHPARRVAGGIRRSEAGPRERTVDARPRPLYTHRSAAGPSRGFSVLLCLRTTT